MRRKNPDRSRHQSAPAVRLGQPVAELGTVTVFRQCTHKPDHADQFSTRLTKGKALLRNARLLFTTLQPRIRIGFGIWKRHRQGVARNLRVAQVSQTRFLISTSDKAEVIILAHLEAEIIGRAGHGGLLYIPLLPADEGPDDERGSQGRSGSDQA